MSLTLNYLCLMGAIVMEVVATTTLARTDNFTRLYPSLLTAACYALSFWLISFPMKVMPTGLIYATWSGVGIVLISATAWYRYGQKLDFPALLGIFFIILGCVIANGFSKTIRH